MSEVDRLKARIAELESVIEPLLPYADLDSFTILQKYNKSLPDWEERRNRIARDTMFTDSAMFKHIAHVYRRDW